ncbi:hypothetical protein [Paenibacillus popilliae]|uniref:Uncharacterized protein n=1 Tax=Paenibacillus popilliae TaxID=78057 RepID=A0ABY3AWM8_PAEPP|nr:hypothetical protein [Paenibacillus sp. SDF0028]TQR47207.1 hypothetical protein C7Y44_06235 [Paenibacillus sp. SDF0028]
MISYLISLTSEQKFDLIKTLIPSFMTGLSVIIGAFVTVYQINKNKIKEIGFKIHEQRKEKYEELIRIFRDVLVNAQSILEGEIPFDKTHWLNSQLGMTLYGSTEVIKKVNKLNEVARAQRPATEVLICFGELILEMRKEVGFNNKGLSVRECLSLYITDINESKYDRAFQEYEKRKKSIWKNMLAH